MGDVDEHRSCFETPDELAATGCEADLAESVGGARERVVDEMRQPDHPIAGSSERVDVRDVAVEGLAPSIASIAPVTAGGDRRAARYRSRSPTVRMSVNRPPDAVAIAFARAARKTARSSRLV